MEMEDQIPNESNAFSPMNMFILQQFNLNKHNATPDDYNIKAINDIIYDEKKKIVCKFKEYLLIDETNDFLKRFYKKTETKSRIQKIVDYYHSEFMPSIPNYCKLRQRCIILKNFDKKQKLFAIKRLEKEEAYDKKSNESKLKFSTFCKSPIESCNTSINDVTRKYFERTSMIENNKENSLLTMSILDESRNFHTEDPSKKLLPNVLNISCITIIKENKNLTEKSFSELNIFDDNTTAGNNLEYYKNTARINDENFLEENMKLSMNSLIFSNLIKKNTHVTENKLTTNDNVKENLIINTNSNKILEIPRSNKNQNTKLDKNIENPPKLEALKFNNIYVENSKSTSRIVNTSQSDNIKKNIRVSSRSKDPLKNTSASSNKLSEVPANKKVLEKNNEAMNSNAKQIHTDRKIVKPGISKTSGYFSQKPPSLQDSLGFNTNSRRESLVSNSKSKNLSINIVKAVNLGANNTNANTNTNNTLTNKSKISSFAKGASGLGEINLNKEKINTNKKISISTSNFFSDLKSPKTVRSNAGNVSRINFPKETPRRNLASTSVQPKISHALTNLKLKFTSNNLNSTSVKPVAKTMTNNNKSIVYQTSKAQLSNAKISSMASTPLNKETKTFSIKLDLNSPLQATSIKQVIKTDSRGSKADISSLLSKKYSELSKLKPQSTTSNLHSVRTFKNTTLKSKTNFQGFIPSMANTVNPQSNTLNKLGVVQSDRSRFVNTHTKDKNYISIKKNANLDPQNVKNHKNASIEIEKGNLYADKLNMNNFNLLRVNQNGRSLSKKK